METRGIKEFNISDNVLASAGKRLATYLIDIAIFYALSFLTGVILGVLSLIGFRAPLEYIAGFSETGNLLFTLMLWAAYYLFFESLTGRTIGKYITGTIVVWDDGTKPDMGTIGVRTLCRMIPLEFLSFLGETHRGWHDSLSKTYVADAKKLKQAMLLHNEFEEIGTTEEEVE